MSMEQKDLTEYVGKKIKVILKNNYYYRCRVLSVGDTYLKIRDVKDTIILIVLDEIKIVEVLE